VRKITLRGRVSSGGGTGSFFVNLPWAKKQFKEKLGFDPYPGT
jgi:riboflavin kinase